MKELEYIQTLDMTLEERKIWEKENMGVAVSTDTDGVIELHKTAWFSTDENLKMISRTGRPALFIALYDSNSEDEIHTLLSDQNIIRRLRDYLNDYLEIYQNTNC